jgi:hypothetical protein
VNGKQYPGNGSIQPIFPKDQGEMVNDQAGRQKKLPHCCTKMKKNLEKFNFRLNNNYLIGESFYTISIVGSIFTPNRFAKAYNTRYPASASAPHPWFGKGSVRMPVCCSSAGA